MRYTVREFEEAVIGAQIRHAHLADLLMRHALVTGQWSEPVTFVDLTGRDKPLPLDPRSEEEAESEPTTELDETAEADRVARAKAMLFEAQLRRRAEQGRLEVRDGG